MCLLALTRREGALARALRCVASLFIAAVPLECSLDILARADVVSSALALSFDRMCARSRRTVRVEPHLHISPGPDEDNPVFACGILLRAKRRALGFRRCLLCRRITWRPGGMRRRERQHYAPDQTRNCEAQALDFVYGHALASFNSGPSRTPFPCRPSCRLPFSFHRTSCRRPSSISLQLWLLPGHRRWASSSTRRRRRRHFSSA